LLYYFPHIYDALVLTCGRLAHYGPRQSIRD